MLRGRKRVCTAWVLAVLLLSSACGGGGDAEPRKVGESGGFTTYTVEFEHFSVAVPSDWRAFSGEALKSADFDEFEAENPALALPEGVEDLYSFLAVDPDLEGGVATNVNVIVAVAPPGSSIEDAAPEAVRVVKELPIEPRSFEHELVTLPGGRAIRLEYTANVVLSGMRQLVATRQWGFLVGGNTFVITFVAPETVADEYETVFARSAATFRALP